MLTLLKKAARLTSRVAASFMLLGGLSALTAPAQAGTVTLTASGQSATMPDGTVVPMWGLSCNGGVSAGVTCAAANAGAGASWSPVIVRVDTSVNTTGLTITLQNQLSFNGNNIPTSLVIVGQVGGGLGTTATTAASPTHAVQQTTWPVVASGATNTPPGQLPRVQSFATEVAAGSSGTYTFAAASLRPGTYLIESGTHPSIQGPMGLYGVLIVTNGAQNQAYPGNAATNYDADIPVVFSEIDPVQNIAVDTAVRTTGFSETAPWSAMSGACGDAAVHTCYPPTVNYSPRYYLVNGVSFDRSNLAASSASVLPLSGGVAPTSTTGKVLVRYVNAGLKMHVPTVVGLKSTIIAEDGNVLPGNPRVQSEVFLAAGKTHDVLLTPKLSGGRYVAATYPIFDRQLSLTTNSQRDGGMQAYLNVAGGATTGVGSAASAVAVTGAANKQFYCQSGTPLVVANANAGVLAGVSGANGATLVSQALPTGATLNFNANGTFSYNPPATGACDAAFNFAINNGVTNYTATISECDAASYSAAGCTLSGPPVLQNDAFTSTNAKTLTVRVPGVLANDTDPAGRVLKVDPATIIVPAGSPMSVSVAADGSFVANATAPGTYTFTYNVRNTQQVAAVAPATVTVTFPTGSGLQVHLLDNRHAGQAGWTEITDYRWIIEEDRTFFHDPKCQVNNGTYGQTPTNTDGTPALDSYGHACPPLPIEALGYNMHSAGMPTVATGCMGAISCEAGQTLLGTPAACTTSNGVCTTSVDATTGGRKPLSPADVALDPYKHYFISVMPGDGINPTLNGTGGPVCAGALDASGNCTTKMRQFDLSLDCPNPSDFVPGTGGCGHEMSGAQIPPAFDSTGAPISRSVTINLIETPLPTAQISVLVYEDDYPLNGENDAGGGVDILANNEPGLPDFQILLLDQAGQLADNVGQMTYDMFNQPLTNALAGTIDPFTQADACPVTSNPDLITGMIITCPEYESDHVTLSPLAGQAVIANLPGGLYEVQSMPNADRIARGEEWLQTNTLDGGKPHEAFIRPGEPRQFQEFGPGGFHVQIGYANPKIINDRRHNAAGTGLCDPAPNGGGLSCTSTVTGHVHGNHMSRTPDERTYDTGTYDAFGWSQCYVSIGIPDEEDIAFAKCDGEGNFSVANMPNGVYKVAVFDEWNDIMLDGLVSSINVTGNTDITLTATQWRTNMYTRAYLDLDGNGIPTRDANGNDLEPGLALIPMNIRYRDGEMAFKNQTDANGYATWNEIFPLMAWLVVEPDYARYKSTGVHVVYDAGGPDDCSPAATQAYGANARCSKTAAFLAGTTEFNSLPVELRVPGARYCTDADCSLASDSIQNGAYFNQASGNSGPTAGLSSGRIDPPELMEGWQGLLGQHSFIDFGFKPYAAHENGGIKGMVVYASTRPFDDPSWLVQNQWEPGIPNATVNLYKKSVATDGTTTLTLVDTLQTESFDTYSQGFRTDGTGTGTLLQTQLGTANAGYIPNMNCPGQDPSSGFFATLQGSKMWLDSGSGDQRAAKHQLAYKSQFKCFDGWSMLNQIQPTTYDGHYSFPSVTDRNPTTGRPSQTNCAICVANPDDGNPMLPAGDYVVEVIPPTGYEVVKEEDKNILMGDTWIAPVTQQFAGFGSVFIMPDQASVSAYYNKNNTVDPTNSLGVTVAPRGQPATFDGQQQWPCVGETRVVPDYLALFPGVQMTAPFAGATRPLCDRKEVQLSDQMGANALFFLFTTAHKAGRFYGVMSDDMASEFDPFSPAFGEKFGPPNLPVGMRNFEGHETVRVYADQWGIYNGLYPSSWEVNPPDPSGFAPQMSIACMNDAGPILDQTVGSPTYGQMITDPAYNPAYSNFCYEHPHMPGVTAYMDTPVTPVQAFADHYNLPDAEYPDGTPVIRRADFQVTGSSGPWAPMTSGVSTVTVGNRGSYASAPGVTLSGGGGTGAAATATMRVGSINLTNGGTYTSAPTVTITGTGTGATATACVGVTSTTITLNPQVAWPSTTVGPVVVFNGTSTQTLGPINLNGATATANFTGSGPTRKIASLNVTAGGCYVTLPNQFKLQNTLLFPTTTTTVTNGTGATWTYGVDSVTVTAAGSGYTAAPTVSFSGTGSGATATASLAVDAVTVTAAGSGYNSAPTVAFAGSGGATATATLGAASAQAPLVLTAFGDRSVQNPVYSGPNASTAPYNQRTITRHYGFGAQCAAADVANHTNGCLAVSSVQILGPQCRESDFGNTAKGCVTATINSWTDTSINVSIPSGVPACVVQQQGQSQSLCGQVVVVSGNGKQSVDGITITLGGKAPTVVTPASPSRDSHIFGDIYPTPLQTAIDNAAPGDLLIVEAGTYRENVIVWKPVRLQGVGAGSVTINADAQPAQKIASWRRQMSCLFGLTTQGAPNVGNAGFDPETHQYSCPTNMYFRSDRLPFEGFVGWDTSSNGNLMQLIIEPSLMGAYEGAGFTVVGRGVNQLGVPAASVDPWGQSQGGGEYAMGAKYLSTNSQGNALVANPWASSECTSAVPTGVTIHDYYTGNFDCNPSTIDGFTVTNSSQGGGGIFIHGWNHHLQVANNRIMANAGTLAGAINLGNGEVPPAFVLDNTTCGATGLTPAPLCPPIPTGVSQVGMPIPYRFNYGVRVHHNQMINNASIGDALFSYVPSGAGGLTISAGADNYEADHNWIAANLTAGDGAGLAHMGVSENGSIHNNFFLFNESNNPTLEVDGGGLIVMGGQEDRVLPDGNECGGSTDSDCPPGLSFGIGHNLVIDANLILGNGAAYGSGGGIRLRQVNGAEVSNLPKNPEDWYGVTLTNNIIANNVAGWDGGGISIQDALKVVIANNTIASNDTTASAGVLFKTMSAAMGASPPPGCVPTSNVFLPANPNCASGGNAPHMPQPAGLVTMQNTPNLMASMAKYFDDSSGSWVQTGNIYCPPGFGYGTGTDAAGDPSLTNGRCLLVSMPKVVNTMFWQNRAFHVAIVDNTGQPIANQGSKTPNGLSASGNALYSQQNIVALLPTLNQASTGQCVAPNAPGVITDFPNPELYWDVGVRMDQWGTHSLVFNSATINAGYTMDAVATATLTNSSSAAFTTTVSTLGTPATATARATVSSGGAITATRSTTGATANTITALNVSAAGTGYTSAPTITIAAPSCTVNGTTCVQATATVTVSGGHLSVASLTNHGAGYTSTPTVTVSQVVNGITVLTGGSGYTSAPSVTVSSGGATATATISGGVVTGFTVTNGGSGYTSAPNVTVAAPIPTVGVTAVSVTSGGSNYSAAPTLTFSAPAGCTVNGTTCVAATGTANLTAGKVTSVTITNAGAGYTLGSPPTVTLSNEVFGAASVGSLNILSGGVGFVSVPTVAIDAPACTINVTTCVQATATATLTNGVVSRLTLTNAGAGYTTIPYVQFLGGGLTPNFNNGNQGPIAISAKNSIFSDLLNAQFASANNTADATNVIPTSAPVVGQFCNGARVPPEICTQNLGVVNPGTCMGYSTPAGVSEAPGTFPVFTFSNISAVATTDEGNNWINMVYGPLTLTRPTGGSAAPAAIVATPAVASRAGSYTITGGSPAIDAGQNASAYTNHDFFGNPRGQGAGWDIGAMELQPTPVAMNITKTAAATVYRGANVTYTVTVTNNDTINVVGLKLADTLTQTQFASVSWSCAANTAHASSCVSGSAAATSTGTTSIAGTLAGGGLIDVGAGDSVVFTVIGVVKSNATLGAFTNTATTALPAGFNQGAGSATATASVTVQALAPVLTTVSPATANRGATASVTLTGQYLTGATAVAVTPSSGAAVNCTAVTVVSDTSVTASCALPIGTAAGAGTIGVTTPGGSTTTAFTITTPSFSLTSTTPASATRGLGNAATSTNNVSITLAGAGFTAAGPISAVTLHPASPGAAITCTVGAVTDTSIAATCPIANNVNTGAGTISATTALGETNALAFTVNAGAPTLTAVSPSSVVHGYLFGTATYQLTLTGTYLTGATSVTWGGASALTGTCGTPTVVNDTTATVNCGNTALAAATRTIAITTPGGTTGTQTVSVAATATVASTLSIAHTGATTAVTITAGGGLTGVSAVGLYSTLGTAVTGVTCTLGTVTDTSVTANCSDTTAGTATSRVFRLTLGGNNTGSIQTNATTVTLN